MIDLDDYARRIARYIEEYMSKPVNFIVLKNLIKTFVENNPDVDPAAVDWAAYYDDRLTYSELVETFRKAYPMYRWDRPRELSEQDFKEMKRQNVEEIIKELDDEAIELLRAKLKELDEKSEAQQEAKQTEAKRVPDRPKGLAIDLRTLAKYQFLDEYRDFLAAFTIEEVGEDIVTRAKERILQALERGEKGVVQKLDNLLIEALSFITAKILCLTVNDDWLIRRWALAEAVRVERQMLAEDEEVFLDLLQRTGITASRCEKDEEEKTGYPYKISVADYLRLIRGLDGAEWRLVNRTVWRGYVFVTRSELVRLLRGKIAEAFARYEGIKPKLTALPEVLREAAEDVAKELIKVRSRYVVPIAEVSKDEAKWPPCMLAIKNALLSGSEVGHFGNFAFAAFLLNIGYSVEDVIAFFAQRPDFDEKIARYQIEHIAGERGSRIKYKPPSCRTMRAHGLCIEDGKLCPKGIRNPIQYSKTKPRPRPP